MSVSRVTNAAIAAAVHPVTRALTFESDGSRTPEHLLSEALHLLVCDLRVLEFRAHTLQGREVTPSAEVLARGTDRLAISLAACDDVSVIETQVSVAPASHSRSPRTRVDFRSSSPPGAPSSPMSSARRRARSATLNSWARRTRRTRWGTPRTSTSGCTRRAP